MKEIVAGRIKTIDEENRIISIFVSNRIRYFYIQRAMLNKVGKYLDVSRFIQFAVTGETRVYKKHKIDTIDYFIRIMEIRHRKNIVYYDIKKIKKGTKEVINSLDNKMFLDLEMSMHPYKVDKNFKQEVIQVGYSLIGKNNEVIEEYNEIIQPTRHKKITRRTQKFLKITQEEVDAGIPFKQFYDHFRAVVEQYDPAIIVWGRNDFLALREGYQINQLPTLRKKTRYINLLKLHKNYFNLKNDLGLFNAYKLYYDVETVQAHNALEDALVTKEIFEGFKRVLNQRQTVDLSNFK